MLIIARTTGVQIVVMNGIVTHESCDTGKQKGVESLSAKTRVTAQMRRGVAGRSRRWHQKPETLACRLYTDERAERPDDVR